ncbi:Immunoglobulin-like domain [Trinorchestia longiramus]|nr:Immunoglobulin-like domain [Trinorchestia longiramus]
MLEVLEMLKMLKMLEMPEMLEMLEMLEVLEMLAHSNMTREPRGLGMIPNVTVVEGENALLTCPSLRYGTPNPHHYVGVTWGKEGLPLAPSIRLETISNGSLVVHNVRRSDGGVYACTSTGASASAATRLLVTKTVVLLIRPDLFGGPLPVLSRFLPSLCSPSSPIPPQVLLFRTLSEQHSGSYTCLATNAAATTNHTATLSVQVAPRWTAQPRGDEGLVGEALSLPCSARGVPTPTITWKKSAGAEPKNFLPLQLGSLGLLPSLSLSQRGTTQPIMYHNGTLHFPALRKADAGWYLCEADNGVLTPLASYVKLSVHAGAQVVSPGGRVTGLSGQLVTLTCQAVGDPPLTLHWTKGDHPLPSEGRWVSTGPRVTTLYHLRAGGCPLTLHWTKGDHPLPSEGRFLVDETTTPSGGRSTVLRVSPVSPSDGGEYRCTASNRHGSHTAAYKVAVLEPPQPPSDVRISDVTSHSATVAWVVPHPATVWLQYTGECG